MDIYHRSSSACLGSNGYERSIADAFGKFRLRSPLRASGSHEERTAVFWWPGGLGGQHRLCAPQQQKSQWIKQCGMWLTEMCWVTKELLFLSGLAYHESGLCWQSAASRDGHVGPRPRIWILGEAFYTHRSCKNYDCAKQEKGGCHTCLTRGWPIVFLNNNDDSHLFCGGVAGSYCPKGHGNWVEEVKLLDCLLKDPLLGLQCWATRNMERESFLAWIASGGHLKDSLSPECQLWIFALRRLRQTWCWSRTVSVPMPLGLNSCQNWKSWGMVEELKRHS